MPVMDGYQTFPIIKKDHPETKIIVLTMLTDENVVHHSLQLGAKAMMIKSGKDDVKHVVKSVWENGYYFSNEIKEIITKKIVNGSVNLPLKNNERQLIKLIANGNSSKEIAEIMCLSENTVNSYRQNLLKSTRTRNTDELVAFAFHVGLLS